MCHDDVDLCEFMTLIGPCRFSSCIPSVTQEGGENWTPAHLTVLSAIPESKRGDDFISSETHTVMNKIAVQVCAALGMAGVVASLTTTPAGIQAAQSSVATVLPRDGEIHKMLAERVGVQDNAVGIVVCLLEPQSRRIISYGHRNAGDARPLDGDTVFEIGSMTKVFTALLLADMVAKKEVALSDPAAKYLPVGVKVPERNGRSITLVDLATHTSGLPFMPQNAPPPNDPAAAKYSAADLKQYVAGYQLPRDIGAAWEYSNIGYWVLSEALSSRAAKSYENLVRSRVIAPLKLANTDFVLSSKMKTNLAVGHDAGLQPAPVVSALGIYSIMPAAGALYSTVNDLSMLLSVAMGNERSPLGPAMETTVNTRRPSGSDNEQALGWTVIGKGDDQVIFRDGGTYGYASSMAWDPKKRVGVIVLSNQVGSVDDIARHLLRPHIPLAKPANTRHTEIAIDSTLLDTYAGRYEAESEGIFTVAREGNFLTIESPADWGLPKLRIRPESPRDFFASELPLRVAFKIDNDGRATGLLIYPPRGQKAVPARRLASVK
jgi:serine-type D-Ala-D-Ala carboxypeptidase/endopeptidase